MDTKICTECGKSFPLSDFRIKVKAKGYRISKCPKCDREYRAARYSRLSKTQQRRERQKMIDARRAKIALGDFQEPKTKKCFMCKQTLPIENFAFRNEALYLRLARCRKCQQEYRLAGYNKNKKPFLERNQRQRHKLRSLVDQAKNKPCQDCGKSFPPCAMDFDHRDPTTKVAKISSMVYCGSKQLLLDEMSKCDVVCAICHRIRTAKQRERKHDE